MLREEKKIVYCKNVIVCAAETAPQSVAFDLLADECECENAISTLPMLDLKVTI
jgi:hypothetical protein